MKHSKAFLKVLTAAGMTADQFDEKTKDLSPYDRGHEKIKMCVDHENGPDPGECIYYPWFWKKNVDVDEEHPSGVGLSFVGAVSAYSDASVPARLKYRTQKIAASAGKKYLPEYEEFFLATK